MQPGHDRFGDNSTDDADKGTIAGGTADASVLLDCSADLTATAYDAVVHGGAQVAIHPAALDRVERHRSLFLRHLETGVICYGVNTGLGALSKQDLSASDRAALPRHILLGRAAAIGVPFKREIVRGALLIKLAQFLGGGSAVTPALCQFLAARLNDGFAPYVPSEGLGMAGEIIPLCHLAQTLIGEGFVLGASNLPQPTELWYRQHGVIPYEPAAKEGLSLINGTAIGPAYAADLLRQMRATFGKAELIAAASIEGLAAPLEPYDALVGTLRRDRGLSEATARLRELLRDSGITRQQRQAPVSFRVTPQIHAVAERALADLASAIADEMISTGDNPAFIADEDDESASGGRLLHCGNFHAAALTQAVEAAALAQMQLGLLAERRLHRLLDQRASALAPQLAKQPGLDAGLVTLHKAALGFSAELRALAVPPSLMHGECSFGQEDVMTMLFPALDRLARIDRINRCILSYEAYAALVAIDARMEAAEAAGETQRPSIAVADLRGRVRATIPAYAGDRSYGPEIERLMALLFD
jgi:histidine ammonia-lyase